MPVSHLLYLKHQFLSNFLYFRNKLSTDVSPNPWTVIVKNGYQSLHLGILFLNQLPDLLLFHYIRGAIFSQMIDFSIPISSLLYDYLLKSNLVKNFFLNPDNCFKWFGSWQPFFLLRNHYFGASTPQRLLSFNICLQWFQIYEIIDATGGETKEEGFSDLVR